MKLVNTEGMRTRMLLNLFRGFFLLGSLIPCCDVVLAKDPADYVNPLIGTSSMNPTKEERARLPQMDPNFDGFHGKLFPGACTPAGMVQLSPDTITGGDNGAGYCYPHYHHSRIQLSTYEWRGSERGPWEFHGDAHDGSAPDVVW